MDNRLDIPQRMNRLEDYSRLIDGWFWETDAQNRFVYMSENVESATGVAAEWHIGKARIELLSECLNEKDLSDHVDALAAHEPFYDFRFKRKGPNGEIWISTSGEPFFDETSAFKGYRGVARDISKEIALTFEAEQSRHQLINALEIIDEGFVYYDKDDRLVLCNEKYREYYPKSRDLIVPGAKFEDIIREGAKRGEYEAAQGRVEEWVAERMAQHLTSNSVIEQRHTDGRWLRIAERKTPDGGIIGFRVDITELKNANLSAERASRAKSEFLATMSHELRTPLTSIKGSLRLLEFSLQEKLMSKEEEMLVIAIRNSDAMLLLVNELLDYEKIISGALEIETTPHEICSLTERVIKDNIGYAKLQSVNFIYDKPKNTIFANVHEHRFEQILRNLLSNAAKFSNPKSDIEIGVLQQDRTVVISVKDSGPGIPDEFKNEIFNQFTQLDSSSSRESAGTGLGLPISKALSEGMGGTIDFETQVGVGTTFRVCFPEINSPAEMPEKAIFSE